MDKPVRDQGGKAQWSVPTMGVLNGYPIHSLPENALHSSHNMVLVNNVFRPRPHFTPFTTVNNLGRVTGALATTEGWMIAVTGAPVNPGQLHLGYVDFGTNPAQIILTTTRNNGGMDNPSRFATIAIGTPTELFFLHANGSDVLTKRGALSVWEVVAEDAPIYSDLTVINNRIIGVVPPYTVQWGEPLDLDTWDPLNTRILADTPDHVIAIRNRGIDGGTVYKSNSIWPVEITGSDDSSLAFRIRPKIYRRGPACSAAVVQTDDADYYITDQGRVGRWDGYRHDWVADGVWPIVEAEIDKQFPRRVHGFYKSDEEQIWFFYPRIGDGGNAMGILMLHLPSPREARAQHIAFTGSTLIPMSASTDSRNNDPTDPNKSFTVAFSTTARGYLVGKVLEDQSQGDDGLPFSWNFRTGLAPVHGPHPARVDSVETFGEVAPGDTALVNVVYTDKLNTNDGFTSVAFPLNSSTDVRPHNMSNADAMGRFVGLEYSGLVPMVFKWRGAIAIVSDRG